jgi:hypothetical protein
MTDLNDPFVYFSTWALLISCSIFVWSIFLGVPKWLFLFAACFLTTTSIMGTFFIKLPAANINANQYNTTTQKIILEDAFIHSGPLILFLLLFNFLKKYVIEDKSKVLFELKKPKIFTKFTSNPKFIFTLQGYHKVAVLVIIISLAYLGYIKFNQVYFYDYFTLIILTLCVFVTSFQIYTSIT